MAQLQFEQVARIPEPQDNVAIAVRDLPSGTVLVKEGRALAIRQMVLEGHRFAVTEIAPGENLLSWGLPFGIATMKIVPGDYICNEKILSVLSMRHVPFQLPARPNFVNHESQFVLKPAEFRPGKQVARYPESRTFLGYARGRGRGVGTRNYIVVLGTSSLTSSLARTIASRFSNVQSANFDGVVAIAHTEGAGPANPSNLEFVLRALAGYLVHPNVGAVLALDIGNESINNRMLSAFCDTHGYPLDAVRHQFISASGSTEAALSRGDAIVRSWIELVSQHSRTPQSVEHLKIALQCGGSDAFSGISGNPLAGWVAKEVIRHGGSANLAETDELIGAEPYVLENVRDLETAEAFLRQTKRFQERASWHGTSAEGNPGGGNLYRGLYNITIKSIGAARKRDPEVRLDYVIEYGERMQAPGYYFMDSPGNDLESIAGQVAAGCNLVLFTTGNGSITNFPFVPTIKIMTNSGRYALLRNEMDVNAGRYLEGTPMETLGQETFQLALQIASGQKSAGEHAGHSQVQIWREWRQRGPAPLSQKRLPSGKPLSLPPGETLTEPNLSFKLQEHPDGAGLRDIALIMPTSLCSGQVGLMMAAQLNQRLSAGSFPNASGLHQFAALAHTEGCGIGGADAEEIPFRTMCSYLRHPSLRAALLLEHGCEKTHNAAMLSFLEANNVETRRFGWASIQLDGGLERVSEKVSNWFATHLASEPRHKRSGSLGLLRIGFVSEGSVAPIVAQAIALIIRSVTADGGHVVIPENSALLSSSVLLESLLGSPYAQEQIAPTLAYGQFGDEAGFHIMEMPTAHSVEAITGVAASGVEVIIAFADKHVFQAHPFVPVMQVAYRPANEAADVDSDLDLVLTEEAATKEKIACSILERISGILARQFEPKLLSLGQTHFQLTRGLTGISL